MDLGRNQVQDLRALASLGELGMGIELLLGTNVVQDEGLEAICEAKVVLKFLNLTSSPARGLRLLFPCCGS